MTALRKSLRRQRLRDHYLDLREQYQEAEPGSAVWFDLERAMRATERLHVTLYREAIVPVHEAGPRTQKPPPA